MTTPDDGSIPPVTGSAPVPSRDTVPNEQTVVHKVEIEARIIWQAIGAVLTTLVLLWALNEARGVVSMVAISLFFSLALEPLVRRLTERFEWRRGAATGVVYVGGLLFGVFLIVILIPSIAQLAKSVGENGAAWIADLNEFTEDNLGFELSSEANAAELLFINGLGFFFTMVAVGVPTTVAISLALFGGFVSVFIPAVGTYIGAAIPILITLALEGVTAALIVLGYAVLYQQVENYWLSPKISSETMTLNGGVAFGAAIAGGAIAGPMGAFTALPVAALMSSFISNYSAFYEVVYESPPPTEAQSSKSRKRKKRKAGSDGNEGP
jgi:predicted PurR-regulated permease PerM